MERLPGEIQPFPDTGFTRPETASFMAGAGYFKRRRMT
jgi:hypothetical protein